jgi:hypothetical protein
MQVTGMLHGAKLLQFAGFPTSEVLGPAASEGEIKDLIARHGSVFMARPACSGAPRTFRALSRKRNAFTSRSTGSATTSTRPTA